jgi:hypothetical protein
MPSSTKLVLQRRAAHLGGRSASVARDPPRPQVVQAIRRRLPPGSDPAALLFTGPGGGPGQLGSPRVKKGTRTVVSRNNFRRTYRGALAKLTRPATAGLRPTAARVLKALHDHERGKRLPQGRGQLRDPPSRPTGAVPGHWEGDLVLGRRPSAVGTLVERRSRYVGLFPLPEGFTAQRMRPALTAAVLQLPQQLRRSLTWDHGKEMAEHLQFTIDPGVQVHFCDPRSPGSVAPTRTPTACSANTCPGPPTCASLIRPRWMPSRPSSTADLDKPWDICSAMPASPPPTNNPSSKVDALTAAGCYRVVTETASGARTDRPTLEQLLDQLRPGDTLVVGNAGNPYPVRLRRAPCSRSVISLAVRRIVDWVSNWCSITWVGGDLARPWPGTADRGAAGTVRGAARRRPGQPARSGREGRAVHLCRWHQDLEPHAAGTPTPARGLPPTAGRLPRPSTDPSRRHIDHNALANVPDRSTRTASLSGFCTRACFHRTPPATCTNDAPLQTVANPLGSGGMWTKRGPSRTRRTVSSPMLTASVPATRPRRQAAARRRYTIPGGA